MKYVVYCHTNRINGKRYIGQCQLYVKCDTAYEAMMKRWKRHCDGAKSGLEWMLSRAIRKYQPESFDHNVLEIVDTLQDANLREIELIREYQTFFRDNPDKGYNMTRGGDGTVGHVPWNKGKKCPEHGQKVKNRKFSPHTDEWKHAQSLAKKGKKLPKHTIEQNRQKSLRQKGKKHKPMSIEQRQHLKQIWSDPKKREQARQAANKRWNKQEEHTKAKNCKQRCSKCHMLGHKRPSCTTQ